MPGPLLRVSLFLVAAGGVALAVVGMLRLSLGTMAVGAVLWLLGAYGWERLSGGYRP